MPQSRKTSSKPASLATIDPKRASASFAALEPALHALPSDKLRIVRVDAQRAAVHAYGTAQRDSASERAQQFEKLVKAGVIERDPCDRLAQRALATWYARQQQLRFLARGGGVVPAATVERADAIKRRMLKVLTHAFDDHASYSLDIAAIRQGSGYQDLANDLQQLADLYEIDEVDAVISRDPIHYHKRDIDDARSRAAEIFTALGYESREAAQWTAKVQRAYTLLDDAYTEHCHAGALLFFRREDVEVTYPPTLIGVVRQPRGRSLVEGPDVPPEPEPEPEG